MKTFMKMLVLLGCWSFLGIGALEAQTDSWGDSGAMGRRESASTAPATPSWMALDGEGSTFWGLTPGSASGWMEVFWGIPRVLPGMVIEGSLPDGVALAVSVMKQNHWAAIPGAMVEGPLNDLISLSFPETLGTTTRYLVTLEGAKAAEAEIREIRITERSPQAPFVKVLPASYTFNQEEYINLQPERLWDGIADNSWFEPLWDSPFRLDRRDRQNYPGGLFPPFFGYPPKNAEIIWELDGIYDIQTLKAKFQQKNRSVRIEFWDGESWVSAQTLGDGWYDRGQDWDNRDFDQDRWGFRKDDQTEWLRIDLSQPISTNRLRITFPEGWNNATDIGELEVWGSGWPESEVRPLVISPLGSDGTRLFTIEDLTPADWTLEVVAKGTLSEAVTGDWNGNDFSIYPSTWHNGQTIYRKRIDEQWLRQGTQFLRIVNAQSVLRVSLLESFDNNQIDLGWPYADGIVEKTSAGPDGTIPALKTKTWELGTEYILEHIRVYSQDAAALSLKTGITKKWNRVEWTPVEWIDQGNGYWEAALKGVLADRITLESSQEIHVDEIQLSGTKLTDRKIGIEIWWPSGEQLSIDKNDDGSVIGWTGSSDVMLTIRDRNPRISGKIFWIPLSELGLDPDEDCDIDFTGRRGDISYYKKIHVRWQQNPPAVFNQGEEFLATAEVSLRISGTIRNSQYRVYIDGQEVAKSGRNFSVDHPLQDGYQKISAEVWDKYKRNLLVSWTKEVYRIRDVPLLVLDQPFGDCTCQPGSLTLAGRVGNGIGLTLTINGIAVPLQANQFVWPVTLKEGAQTYLFTLTDVLGAKTSLLLSISRDSTAPIIKIESPAAGQYLSNSVVPFTVSAGGESGLWWKINDEPWEFDPNHPHVKTYRLTDGFYHFEVIARDGSGNESERLGVDFIVDATPPEAFVLMADVSGWTSNRNPTLTFATTDVTSGLDHYEYRIDEGNWSGATSPLTLPSLSDGVHLVLAKALDKAGNYRTSDIILYTDATAPQAFEASVNVTGWTPNNRPTVTFQTSDTTSGVDRYEIQIDNGEWTTQTSPFRVSALSDGIHTIGTQALDRAGNVTPAPGVTVFIDATAPEAFEAEVDVSGWTSNNQPTFTFATTDATSGIDRFEVKIDEGVWTEKESPYQVPVLADGTHTADVRAIDRAGNITNATLITLSIDATPPAAVQNFRLIPGKDRMEALWTTPDEDITVYHVIRTIDSVSMSFDTSSTSLAEEGLSLGTMVEFKIQPEDRAHNLGSWCSADAAIVGAAIQVIDPEATEAVLVEFENIKMAVPPASLSPEVKAVLIKEVESEDLEEKSVNSITGPIYSFTTLQDDGNGSLIETTHTEFENDVLVILNYDESLLPNGFAESNLGVYFFDTLWSRWFRIEKAAIDIERNTIIFFTNHFSDFSIQPTLLEDLKPQELKDAGHSPYKSESKAGEVTVSPQGGTMMTEVTEFVLKGKNGFSFPVKRIYDSQTARVDSPSLNLSMSLGINFGPSMLASITEQLISGGIDLAIGPVLAKIKKLYQGNGDYPLALGIGWRLNLPYVMATDTQVMVRLPTGGYYPINQMELDGEAPLISGVRSLVFENHRGEDFTFKVDQVRGDFSSAIAGLATGGIEKYEEAIENLLDAKNLTKVVGTLASLIPGWLTYSSELITKDGTSYRFDALGRIKRITDPSGTNVITFDYNGYVLSKITDPMGNETSFEYDNGVLLGLFLRPSIIKIETTGPEGQTRISHYEYDNGDVLAGAFRSLPPMTKAWDVGGRLTTYGINDHFLFSGGGSAKINFIALLLDFIPGASIIKDLIGFNTLTISGRITLERPRLIDRIEAPGIGITEISYLDKDLSTFDARPADFFMGIEWLPTALKISYEFLYRILTDSVTVRNGSLSKTTTYDYYFTTRESQWIIEKTIINDGLTSITQEYSIYSRRYNRYVSFDDAVIAALKEGVFTEESNRETEYFPLATKTSTIDIATGRTYETDQSIWDTVRSRPITQTITRGPSYRKIVNHEYDDWGNETNTNTTQTTPQGSTNVARQSWFFGTSSTKPQGFPNGVPSTPTQQEPGTKGLLLGNVTTVSRPSAYFDSEQDIVYQGFAYDAFGRPVWQGLWNVNHWAATTIAYYPMAADNGLLGSRAEDDPLGGRIEESVSPEGQRTVYSYDFSSKKSQNLWIETKTVLNVADPLGQRSNVFEETAFDWGTGWMRLTKNAEGFVTEINYDALGRPISIVKPGKEPASPSGDWPANRSEAPWDRIAYNDTARTSTLFRDIASGTSPTPTATEPSEFYEYDARGNLFRISKYERSGSVVQTSITLVAYDGYNRVLSMKDPLGNQTSYTYDFISRPKTMIFADGSGQSFSYDDTVGQKDSTNERGLVTREFLNWAGLPEVSIADAGGLKLTTRSYYDGLDRINADVDSLDQTTKTSYSVFGKPSLIQHPPVSVFEAPSAPPATIPFVATSNTQPQEVVVYDDEGHPLTVQSGYEGHWRTTVTTYDGLGRAIKQNVDGREIWTWYNGSGQSIFQTDPEQTNLLLQATPGTELANTGAKFTATTYTSRGQIKTQIDPLGAVTTYDYDRDDRKTLMRDPRATGSRIEDFSIYYEYDDLGRLIGADLPPVSGQIRGSVSIVYDLRGNPINQTEADGKVTSWTYDKRNRKTSQTVTGTDGKTIISAWGYDAVGNVIREIAVSTLNTYSPADSQGLVTVKQYDALNRLTAVILPDGQMTKNLYDKLGRVESVRDALDYTTEYDYNSQNKIVEIREPLMKTTRNCYNVWGDATCTTLLGGNSGDQVWVRGYNAFSQLSYELNNAGQIWTFSYDLRGLLTGSSDPNGTIAATSYSPTGLPTQRILTNGGQTFSESWEYDEAGTLKSAIDGSVETKINQGSGSFIADPYDLITSYSTIIGGKGLSWTSSYDKSMRPLSLSYPNGESISYQYNGLGLLKSIPGYAENGQYDFSGRLTRLDAANGTGRTKSWNPGTGNLDGYEWTGTGKTATSILWDTRGNLSVQTKNGYSSTYFYDDLNRLVYSQEGGPIELSTRENAATIYGMKERDVAGRKALEFSKPASIVRLDYNSSSVGVDLGAMESINKVRLYGVGERVSPRTVEVYISSQGTDKSWTKVSGTTLVPDQDGTTIQFAEPVEGQYVKLHLTWDERDAENAAIDLSTISGSPSELIEVWSTVNGQTTSWTYDALGNRISENRYRGSTKTTETSYYTATSRIKTNGEWKYNYDRNGNLTSLGTAGSWDTSAEKYIWDEDTGEVWLYAYDLKNRMTEVQYGKSGSSNLKTVARYTYDIRNLRVASSKAGVTTYYQYDVSGDLIYSEDGSTVHTYIHALGQVWAEERTTGDVTKRYYHHSDHLGTTEAITDANGKIVWYGSYEAFGSLISSNGSLAFNLSYTGKELDSDTGLYYFNARWYSAELGRFIGEDPARDGLNWYVYCYNNPLAFIDPTGLGPLDPDSPGWIPPTASDKGIKEDTLFVFGPNGEVRLTWGQLNQIGSPMSDSQWDEKLMQETSPMNMARAAGEAQEPFDIFMLDLNDNMQKNNPKDAALLIDAYFGGQAIGNSVALLGAISLFGPQNKQSSQQTPNATEKVHGNLKASTNAQHSYEITRTDAAGNTEVFKYGVSGGKVTAEGLSVRAERQVAALNRAAEGQYTYSSKIVAEVPAGAGARQAILNIEKALVNIYKTITGAKPTGNIRP